jgi:hypothetical protein
MHRCPLGRVLGYVTLLQLTITADDIYVFPVVHTIRIHGIYDKNRSVLYGMCALLALQVVITGICCAFYRCELYPHRL